jgi:hypothetical protein
MSSALNFDLGSLVTTYLIPLAGSSPGRSCCGSSAAG